MKMLILGGHGMAGHVLVRHFREQGGHQVFYTSRDPGDPDSLILDAGDIVAVDQAVQLVRPEVIINAVGVLNQFADQDKIMAYHINGFLPHRLRHLADRTGARLIHISTDCVFRGDRGAYREDDQPDGVTTYALTKALGEVRDEGHLTIRTSIIGPEIRRQGIGLFQWFMSQEGKVSGYRRVKWNGVTTVQLAKTIEGLLDRPVSGLVHLAHPEVVSKFEMLHLFQEIWGKTNIQIEPDDGPALDRTLVNTRPDAAVPLPSFQQMLEEMAEWMRRHG
ncbi:MAG: SDR family oxidoreductase [Paenibacillaceae bacterium]|uniref:dTDP-4-dehydrorhamnose reductase n=1 Tax=Paenibacillus mellifer TaxID=2937794 RepID=A0A9X2BSV8_9BACL|nr:SDR family oxidoreductase [Paenibacillus mellifer]MBW4841655.1 SDR family oxidoreductase [Paenibacillaceae bacterium]MCK8488810.1 SDR family oxidoreductase [Paenibacillus mellifer]